MENSRKIKERWRKRKSSPEAQKNNAQIRREWRTGRRPAPQKCVELYGETTCKGCPIVDNCTLQAKELEKIKRKK